MVAALRADDQRDMLAQVIARAEGDDLGVLARLDRQARAGLDGELHRILERGEIGGGHLRGGVYPCRDHEGRQDPGQPRQFHGRDRCGLRGARIGTEGAAHRFGQIERRIGKAARGMEREGFRAMDHHRHVRFCGIALVGKLQRGRARMADQQPRGIEPGLDERGLGRQQIERAIFRLDPDRPAMAQRVERQRHLARIACAQSANSVISGTWSEG